MCNMEEQWQKKSIIFVGVTRCAPAVLNVSQLFISVLKTALYIDLISFKCTQSGSISQCSPFFPPVYVLCISHPEGHWRCVQECVGYRLCPFFRPQRFTWQWPMCFVETADCETDGYLSSSGLQDPLETGSASMPATSLTTHPNTPAVNGLSLRFPSVSGFNKELVIKVAGSGW